MPKCKWTAEAAAAGLDARMPGKGDIDLSEWINSVLADKTLSRATLTECAQHARRVAKVMAGHAHMNPRKCLETVLKKLAAPAAASKEG